LNYEELWINIRTLFRNFMGALDPTTMKAVSSPEISEAMLEEMVMIESIISEATNNRTKVIFYYSNYNHLGTYYKKGIVRMDNTPKQTEYTAIQNNTIKLLLAKQEKDTNHDIRVFELDIIAEHRKKALILTNYAIDLLSHKAFTHLTLLESHTGKLKDKALWYTKYYQGKELSNIPFTRAFIQVFGDAETFRPMDNQLRKEIMEIAKKYNWTSITTTEKLIYGINQMQNPYSKEILKSIIHA